MKTNNYLYAIVLFSVFESCSSSDDVPTLVDEGGRKFRQLTITHVQDMDATRSFGDITRALLTENEDGKTLSAFWEKDDNITYCNISTLDRDILSYLNTGKPFFGNLETKSSGKNSDFFGNAFCGDQDVLSFIYPVGAFSLGPNVMDENNISHPTVQYTIDLSGQDGTLETLARKYYFGYGEANVVVQDDLASAQVEIESLIAICRFSFFVDYDNPIPINRLSINYEFNDWIGKYPVEAKLTAYPGYHNLEPIIPDSKTVLDIRPTQNVNTIYVALLPTSSQGFKFTVINDEGTYEGKYPAALKAGEFYPTQLKLTKISNN